MAQPSSLTPMTDEDARAAVARGWGRRPPVGLSADDVLSDAFSGVAAIAHTAFDLDDLRDSELERLDELAYDAIQAIRDDVRWRASEALVGVLLAFTGEHPDAPRARR